MCKDTPNMFIQWGHGLLTMTDWHMAIVCISWGISIYTKTTILTGIISDFISDNKTCQNRLSLHIYLYTTHENTKAMQCLASNTSTLFLF